MTLQSAKQHSDGAHIGTGGATSSIQAEIAVTIELASPADRAAIYANAHGLTVRETELLKKVLSGADSHDLAHSLFLSEHTVQDFLKSIFTKAGVRSRRQLIGRIVGTRD